MQCDVEKQPYNVKLHGEIIRVMADNPMDALLTALKDRGVEVSVENTNEKAEDLLPVNVKDDGHHARLTGDLLKLK